MSASKDYPIGHSVVLKTTLGEEITSTIFAYDPETNMLVLKDQGSHGGVSNLRLLKASFIQEVVSATPPAEPVDTRLPYVDLDKCRKREEKALAQAENEASRVGVGVSKEAQAIFDALVKTMPCRWVNKRIIVLDVVQIAEPYTPDTCSADKDHQDTLDRVKKVLQAERARLVI